MNLFDARRWASDSHIPCFTEGYKQCAVGWITFHCPFCTGNPGPHLCFNIQNSFFNCWRCGFHSVPSVVSKLAHCSYTQAQDIISRYSLRPVKHTQVTTVERRREAKLPVGCGLLQDMHIRYLEKRKYDWKMLEETWKIQGTGYFGDYKFRLILPIFQDGRLVSFQGRDITGKSKLRYKACSKEREAVDHKTTLYGEWLIPPEQDWVVVVEGGPDAWRLGVGAVATYGIAYKTAQVRRLRRFKYRYVLFDHPDPQARVQSRRLAGELSVFDGETWELDIPWKDPGEMPQEEADRLMDKIRRRHS